MEKIEKDKLLNDVLRAARKEPDPEPRPDEAWRRETLRAVARIPLDEPDGEESELFLGVAKGLCALSASIVLCFHFWIGFNPGEDLEDLVSLSLTDAAWLSLY